MGTTVRLGTAILVIATFISCHKADPGNRSTVPRVTLVTPVSTQRGDVTISHTLFDSESDPVSILVEFAGVASACEIDCSRPDRFSHFARTIRRVEFVPSVLSR